MSRRCRWILIALLLTDALHAAEQSEDLKTAMSPNKEFFAAARRMPDEDFVYRRDLDGFRVVIYHHGSEKELGDIYAHAPIFGRLILQMAWSPDSKFLVFTTTSSGGHSPWHYTTFVFETEDRSFREVDSVAGSVVSSEFHFAKPDILFIKTWDTAAAKKGKEPLDEVEKKISLSETIEKMDPAR
jgi:hypothetical protein